MTNSDPIPFDLEPIERRDSLRTRSESEAQTFEPARADSTISDKLVLQAVEGDKAALDTLYDGSVRWLGARISEGEVTNRIRWGSVVLDDLPHEIATRVIGTGGSRLERLAAFRSPAAGYMKSLNTALERRLIDENRKWSARGKFHVTQNPNGEEGNSSSAARGDTILSPLPGPDEQAAAADLARLIGKVADAVLSAEERTLLFSECKGVSREQLAARGGITVKAVATRLCRARTKLRTALKKQLDDRDR